MTASIATGPFASGRRSVAGSPRRRRTPTRSDSRLDRWLRCRRAGLVGLVFVVVAVMVYVWSNPHRCGFYDHFVWQAQAWLEGSSEHPLPGRRRHPHQRLLPGRARPGRRGSSPRGLGLPFEPGHALIPFPPLPAVLLLPFVAVWGLATSGALVAAVLGGINVGLCWRMLTGSPTAATRRSWAPSPTASGPSRGTPSMLGTTWFQAHVVASTLLFLSITAALDAERREAIEGAGRAIVGAHARSVASGPASCSGRPASPASRPCSTPRSTRSWDPAARGCVGRSRRASARILPLLRPAWATTWRPPGTCSTRLRPHPRDRVQAGAGAVPPRLGDRGPALHPRQRARDAAVPARPGAAGRVRHALHTHDRHRRPADRTRTRRVRCGPTRWA